MKLEIYQWLVPLVSMYHIIRTVIQYSKGKYSPRNTIIWVGFWLSISLLAIMPDAIANSFAHSLGFKDHINAVIFVALGLLFLMVFYLSAAMNRVENKLTDLVREMAIKEAIKNEEIVKLIQKIAADQNKSSTSTPSEVHSEAPLKEGQAIQ